MALMSGLESVDSRLLTWDDLDALPDDGLRHELIDGAFVMTPAPGLPHQRVVTAVVLALADKLRGTGLEVLSGPYDVALPNPLTGLDVLEPDVLVARTPDLGERGITVAPALVVEVRSPSTARRDQGRKREIYENAGVASYWLIDPREPSLTVLELRGGRYEVAGQAVGDQWLEVTSPIRLRLNPAHLVRGSLGV